MAKQLGGQPGNTSAMKHGLRSIQDGLSLSRLPKGGGHIRKRVSMFRRAQEKAVLDQGREVGLREAAAIQTSCRWEIAAQMAGMELRVNVKLTATEKINLLKLIGWASNQRDLALKSLGIGSVKDGDDIASLYRQPLAALVADDLHDDGSNDTQEAPAADRPAAVTPSDQEATS